MDDNGDNHLLLVEDSEDDAALTLRALKRAGVTAQVVIARDGLAALDELFGSGAFAGGNGSIRPKVILLDLKLPKLGGLEVLQCLRAAPQTQDIPIIILSSSQEELDILDSQELGVRDYLPKPVDVTGFSAIAERLKAYFVPQQSLSRA